MTTVMKVQLNMKFDNTFNTSVSFEHIVSTEEEAEGLGNQDRKLFDAYMIGYGQET